MNTFTHAQKVHALKYGKSAFNYMRNLSGSAATADRQEEIFNAALEEYDRQGAELGEAYKWMEHLHHAVLGFGTEDWQEVNAWLSRNSHLKPA